MAENRFWIGLQEDPDDRRQIVVSDADVRVIREAMQSPTDEPETVTDLLTGQTVTVRRADCGLGCRCALEFAEGTVQA